MRRRARDRRLRPMAIAPYMEWREADLSTRRPSVLGDIERGSYHEAF
jgi:hypothetical protein